MAKARKKALGKDLAALLGEGDLDSSALEETESVVKLALDKIHPNPNQPRRTFSVESIQELANSIQENGLMQPIIVKILKGTTAEYELVSGERRLRAAELAGLTEIKALVTEVTEENSAALALIENIQREDLNPYEQALGLQKLLDIHNYTHQELATKLSKSRAAITNSLRLLKLEKSLHEYLINGKLDPGHAKVLLSLNAKEQAKLGKEVVEKGLSVRELERLVAEVQNKGKSAGKEPAALDPNIRAMQDSLSTKLGVRVEFNHKKSGSGKMLIHYHSLDELEGVLKTLKLKKFNP